MTRYTYYRIKELDYKDVFIVPQYSEITSRKEVNTATKFLDLDLDFPIISANMDTVTDSNVAIKIAKAGGIGALHRFSEIGYNVGEYKRVVMHSQNCLVSIGVNEESKTRAKALYAAGARYFIIDIAHGHSILMKNMIEWLRTKYAGEIKIVAGNIANSDAVKDLIAWGADAIKVGVGPGQVCITKNQTGVTFPQFGAIERCAEELKRIAKKRKEDGLPEKKIYLIADGGLREYGDIAKAIGIGADVVMSGKFFSALKESPGLTTTKNGIAVKEYRGMASKEAMLRIKREEDMATPEGIRTLVPVSDQTIESVIKEMKGALQSTLSYSNSRTIEEFQKSVVFGLC